MGSPKAELDWHGMPLLERVAGIVARIADPVVVVGGPAGVSLPTGTERAEDATPGLGPLEGIAAGLRALGARADAAIVSATDAPFVHPAFLLGVAAALGDHQVAVPVSGGREHPLAACWSASALEAVERAAADGRLRVRSLLAELDTARIDASTLDHPESLRNLNTPEDYRAALAEPLPLVTVEPRGTVRAAHLAAAELNGRPCGPDPVPLVDGDVVRLR
jgi:molybdopterin-guanine dinucleotide biosynthesis protein A